MSTRRNIKNQLRSIVTGVKEDFCEYFLRFEAVKNVRYERFSEIWRDMKFSIIWSGRQTEREAREFMEECMRIAVGFLLRPCSFQTQVGSLYLLYGLYCTQPCSPRVGIRVLPQEWKEITKFYDVIKSEQHYDAVYIYLKLVFEKAFHHVGIAMDVNPRLKEAPETDVAVDRRDMPDITSMIDPVHLESLDAFHNKYHQFKCRLAGSDASRPDTSLDFIHNDLLASVHSLIEEHKETVMNGKSINVSSLYKKAEDQMPQEKSISDEKDDEESEEDDDVKTDKRKRSNIGTRRRNIKSKAFKHAAALPDSKQAKVQSPDLKSYPVTKRNPKLYEPDVNISDLEPAPTLAMCQDTMKALHQVELQERGHDSTSDSPLQESASPKKSGSSSSDRATKQTRKTSKSRVSKRSQQRKERAHQKTTRGSTSDTMTSPEASCSTARHGRRTVKVKKLASKSPKARLPQVSYTKRAAKSKTKSRSSTKKSKA